MQKRQRIADLLGELQGPAMMGEAFTKVRDEVYLIPLHRQVIPWAVRANVKVVHRPDNVVEALWITVGK